MADGRWQMADGRWQMADGRWQMVDRSYLLLNSRRAVWKMVAWTVIGAVIGFSMTLVVYGSVYLTKVPNKAELVEAMAYGGFSIIPGAAVGAIFGAASTVMNRLGEFRRDINPVQITSQTAASRGVVWNLVGWIAIGGGGGFGLTFGLYGTAFLTNMPNERNLITGMLYGVFSIIPGAVVGAAFGMVNAIMNELGRMRREMNSHQVMPIAPGEVNGPCASVKAGLPAEFRRK